ncbi:MAG: HAMP domain-containing sensor histidine kinase, partial [Deltaproteobacteria bacterium]
HEIRNPLAGIKGFAQLVETSSNLEQARRHAEKIVIQSLRMEALVNDLLAFARDDRGELEMSDLPALIQDCAILLRPEAATQNVAIEVVVPAQLKAQVAVDRIIQLLLNLMKNAIQAMPNGGLLTVSLRVKGGIAELTVRDNGIGIQPEHLHHIFEPFWTSKAQGTGLGLALCSKVAEEHGGHLTVESTVGIGTEIVVKLPVQ